jgi:Ca2+/Na+ antiporter
MSKFTAWSIVAACFILPVFFGLFIFWLHGHDFVRGEALGGAVFHTLVVAGLLSLAVARIMDDRL